MYLAGSYKGQPLTIAGARLAALGMTEEGFMARAVLVRVIVVFLYWCICDRPTLCYNNTYASFHQPHHEQASAITLAPTPSTILGSTDLTTLAAVATTVAATNTPTTVPVTKSPTWSPTMPVTTNAPSRSPSRPPTLVCTVQRQQRAHYYLIACVLILYSCHNIHILMHPQSPTTAPTQRATSAPTRRTTPNPTVAAMEALATMAAAEGSGGSSAGMAGSVMDVEMAFTYAGDPAKVSAFQRALQAMLQPYGACVCGALVRVNVLSCCGLGSRAATLYAWHVCTYQILTPKPPNQ